MFYNPFFDFLLENGHIDTEDLTSKLELHKKSANLKIGCFCAASNITGILNDDLKITAILHNFGALSFWDYATAAPYVDINVNPKVAGDVENLCAKDAVYFSMHKFVGGVQTPGVLIAKKELFKRKTPQFGGGGGSVFFVTEKDHKYLQEIELREESGTPAIVESIRAGLGKNMPISSHFLSIFVHYVYFVAIIHRLIRILYIHFSDEAEKVSESVSNLGKRAIFDEKGR